MADWSSIPGNPEIKVFHDHVADSNRLPVAVERPSVTGRAPRKLAGASGFGKYEFDCAPTAACKSLP